MKLYHGVRCSLDRKKFNFPIFQDVYVFVLSIWENSYKNVLQFAVLIETWYIKKKKTGILPWKFCVKGNYLQLKQFSIWKVVIIA